MRPLLFTLTLTLTYLLHISTSAAVAPPYTPLEHILLNCGASSDAPEVSIDDGRVWQADTISDYLPSNFKTISESSTASKPNSSITQPFYRTARIIHSRFTYTFSKLSSESILLRLFFYSSTYNNVDTNTSFFSVTANNYTLMTNFSASLNIQASIPQSPTLVKEYIINLSGSLNVTFLPSNNASAFVNAIEIVSVPKSFYQTKDTSYVSNIQSLKSYNWGENKALETMYRLDVGRNDSVPANDDTGMSREWLKDDDYLIAQSNGLTKDFNVSVVYPKEVPRYTAPETVYQSARFMVDSFSDIYNMTWLFPVDSGFFYLLRLHFCEIFEEDINKTGDRVFTIYINNITATEEADVIFWGGRPNVAVFKDYVVPVTENRDNGEGGKQDLWLSMHPHPKTNYNNALLNGLEIFKLSLTNGSFAAPNPPETIIDNDPSVKSLDDNNNNSKSRVWVIAVIAGVVGGGGVLLLAFLILCWLKKDKNKQEDSRSKMTRDSVGSSSLPAELCRHFRIEEIKRATSNFDDNRVIGVGGFGNVYKGYIEDHISGAAEVAIKRLHKSSKQGLNEFLTEIEMLTKLRHRHLVALIGYCDDEGEMILVYDYMSRGTLHDHLNKTNEHHLSWKRRLQICIGAAKGLDYLHTWAHHSIIHRDVKSTNILLDEKWVAKVSDFGLSKLGPIGGTKTYVSTVVKGSFGYMDPEYFMRKQLTKKSDVYSFGVVLFEVLCSRPAIMNNAPKEEVSLSGWVRLCKKNGSLDQIVDPKVKGEISPECLRKFIELGLSCLKVGGIERPSMSDVVANLELALQLQEAADEHHYALMKENDSKEDSRLCSMPLSSSHSFLATSDDDNDYIFSRSMDGSSSCSKWKDNSDGFSSSTIGFKSQN